MKQFFIAGTDTDVGKTFVLRLLLAKVKQSGQRTLAIKPVAAGVIETPEGLKNEDAHFLQQESSVQLPYSTINPFLLNAPLSPHIAAKQQHIQLNANDIAARCKNSEIDVDYLFFEGAGGWLVPINDTQTMADVAVALNAPVILIVAMRLGCLNHALLTASHILSKNLKLAGFIANQIQPAPQDAFAENIATLKERIPAPLLGIVPYSINKDISSLTAHIHHLP